jgi:hypothetical protein
MCFPHFPDSTISAGTDFLGRGHPPINDLHPPPEAFGTAPKGFCTPANYIYFDLIVSYLIILTTKFVKLPILWSQISPCRPKTNFVKLFPWPFRALPPRPGQSKQQHPHRYLSTPPNESMKIRLCISVGIPWTPSYQLCSFLTIYVWFSWFSVYSPPQPCTQGSLCTKRTFNPG